MSKLFTFCGNNFNSFQSIKFRGFIEPAVAGPVWFMPWLAKIVPERTGFTKLLAAVEDLRNEFRIFIQKRREIHSKETLNDFLDYYLAEIEETEDKDSSFYKEVGSEFVQCYLGKNRKCSFTNTFVQLAI